MTGYGQTFLVSALFLAGLTWVAWRSREQSGEFINGNGNLGFWGVCGSIICYRQAGDMFVFWFLFVAALGFGAFWVVTAYAVIVFLMALLAPRAQRLARECGYITMPDLIKDRHGPLMAKWVNLFSLYGACLLTIAQLFVAGHIIGGLFDIGEVAGTFIGAAIVSFYILLGGFMSVVRTDVYQAVVLIVFAVGALFWGQWPDNATISRQLLSPDLDLIINYAILGLSIPASTDLWQRFFAAKTGKDAKYGAFAGLGIDTLIITFGIIVLVTNILAATPEGKPEEVFTNLFAGPGAKSLTVSLFGIFILSAMMSTLDNQVFNFTLIATKNVLNINIEKNRRRFILILRVISVVMLAAMAVLSLEISDLLQWLITSYSMIGVISPFIVYAIMGKNQPLYGDGFLAFGTLISLACYWYLFHLGLYENMLWYCFPYSIPLLFILADITTRKQMKILTTETME